MSGGSADSESVRLTLLVSQSIMGRFVPLYNINLTLNQSSNRDSRLGCCSSKEKKVSLWLELEDSAFLSSLLIKYQSII